MGQAIMTDAGRAYMAQRGLPGATLTMMLFSSPTVVGFGTVAGDLTEAIYSGYDPHDVVFPEFATDGSHRAVSEMVTLRFQHDGGGTPDVIQGYAIVEHYDTTREVYVVKLFDEGEFTFSTEGDFLDIDITARLFQPGD